MDPAYRASVRDFYTGAAITVLGEVWTINSINTLKDYYEERENDLQSYISIKQYNIPAGYKPRDGYINLGLSGSLALLGTFLIVSSLICMRRIEKSLEKKLKG